MTYNILTASLRRCPAPKMYENSEITPLTGIKRDA